MTLTAVIGASGSGKTTFLNDVHKRYKCIYLRQYHKIRPYIAVATIPNFDPTVLPYWYIYEKEKKDETIKVGGTMAGEFTAGLSGGQRKLLLFELICQRVKTHKSLLILLDEPFAGVTDDFVPFIVERLQQLSQQHNILLVTNDHVPIITQTANNTITVSAVDRSIVQINNMHPSSREMTISALSIGDNYFHRSTNDDLKFFYTVEVRNNVALIQIAIYSVLCFLLLLVAFWNSKSNSTALVLVGAEILSYFCVNPYLLSLPEWRDTVREESDALLHSSNSTNKLLKTILVFIMIFIISLLEYGFVNATINSLSHIKFWIAIFCDNASGTFALIALGIYTNLPFEMVENLGMVPYLLMIFFSSTFSPGSGLPIIKELQYLFPRYYLWCMIPYVQDQMEGCPDDETLNVLYMVLSSFLVVVLFVLFQFGVVIRRRLLQTKKTKELHKTMLQCTELDILQKKLYGTTVLRRFQHLDTSTITDGHRTEHHDPTITYEF